MEHTSAGRGGGHLRRKPLPPCSKMKALCVCGGGDGIEGA